MIQEESSRCSNIVRQCNKEEKPILVHKTLIDANVKASDYGEKEQQVYWRGDMTNKESYKGGGRSSTSRLNILHFHVPLLWFLLIAE